MDFKQMAAICRANLATYDGQFWLAVKTTGIYCLPSCRARFPKLQNICFYAAKEEAIQAGYRGCKRCHSAEYPMEPIWMTLLLQFIDGNLEQRLTTSLLQQHANQSYHMLRKVFLQHTGLTPAQYVTKKKMDVARQQITQGQDYRLVAYGLGYDSLSGFRDAFYRVHQITPGVVG